MEMAPDLNEEGRRFRAGLILRLENRVSYAGPDCRLDILEKSIVGGRGGRVAVAIRNCVSGWLGRGAAPWRIRMAITSSGTGRLSGRASGLDGSGLGLFNLFGRSDFGLAFRFDGLSAADHVSEFLNDGLQLHRLIVEFGSGGTRLLSGRGIGLRN